MELCIVVVAIIVIMRNALAKLIAVAASMLSIIINSILRNVNAHLNQ